MGPTAIALSLTSEVDIPQLRILTVYLLNFACSFTTIPPLGNIFIHFIYITGEPGTACIITACPTFLAGLTTCTKENKENANN
jgi:hypothetical protein